MYQPAFVYDYTSISESGARWIVDHTDWQLIGLDYLSVTTWDDNTIGHQLMLGKVGHPCCNGVRRDSQPERVLAPACCLPQNLRLMRKQSASDQHAGYVARISTFHCRVLAEVADCAGS